MYKLLLTLNSTTQCVSKNYVHTFVINAKLSKEQRSTALEKLPSREATYRMFLPVISKQKRDHKSSTTLSGSNRLERSMRPNPLK